MLPDSSSRISVTRRLRDALEQVVGRHHQPGRAETALHRTRLDERPLDIGRRARLGEPFDRDDRGVDGASRQHEARADQVAVDEHAARAALALFARPFGAEQSEPFAQHVEQALAEPSVGDGMGRSVDVQRVVLSHRNRPRRPGAGAAPPTPRRRGVDTPRWRGGRRSDWLAAAASSPKRATASARDRSASQSTADAANASAA